jgi:NhaA family Na+:H+ antiporter
MSLFIGMLAFPEPQYAADIRIGVLSGSVCAAILGYLLLRYLPAAPASATGNLDGRAS